MRLYHHLQHYLVSTYYNSIVDIPYVYERVSFFHLRQLSHSLELYAIPS
nr:MAG TPA: hypothetical protein [Caudoviricetes sp.]